MSKDLKTVVNLTLACLLLILCLLDEVNVKSLPFLPTSLQAVVQDDVQECHLQENFVSFNLTQADQNNIKVNVTRDLMNFLRNPCVSQLTLQGLLLESSNTSNVTTTTTTATLCSLLQSLSLMFKKVIRVEGCQDDDNNHGHLSSDLLLEKDIETEAGLALVLLLRDQLSLGKCAIFVDLFSSGDKEKKTTNIITPASSSYVSGVHDTWMKKKNKEKWVSLLMRFFPETTLFWFSSSSSSTKEIRTLSSSSTTITTKSKASSDEWNQIVSVLSDPLTPSCKFFSFTCETKKVTHNLSIVSGNTFTGVNHTQRNALPLILQTSLLRSKTEICVGGKHCVWITQSDLLLIEISQQEINLILYLCSSYSWQGR